MADGPSTRRGEMKDSASFSETGSDIGDNVPQDKKEDDCENDNGFVEDRFRVDRKKLEQMLQGKAIFIFDIVTPTVFSNSTFLLSFYKNGVSSPLEI